MGGRRRDSRGRNRTGLIAGRFRLQEIVASGGMGEVYRARDVMSHVQVCVKLLRAHEDRDSQRFVQEAKILSGLEHPAIVRYLAHGVVDEDRYLVMEWLDGEDLSRRLERAPLGLADMICLLKQAAEALAYAHAQDVIHRDIKPHNLFLREGKIDQLKLLDFGIARMVNADRRLTLTGNLVGTPGYLAPETIDGAGIVDGRADVFSLGCVAHECMTGKPTFRGHEPGVLLAKLMLEDAPHLCELLPEVPRAVGDMVARMLSKNPERRPTAIQVLRTLVSLGELGLSQQAQATAKESQITIAEQYRHGLAGRASYRGNPGRAQTARFASRVVRFSPNVGGARSPAGAALFGQDLSLAGRQDGGDLARGLRLDGPGGARGPLRAAGPPANAHVRGGGRDGGGPSVAALADGQRDRVGGRAAAPDRARKPTRRREPGPFAGAAFCPGT